MNSTQNSTFKYLGNVDIYNRPVVPNPTKNDPKRSSTVLSKSFNIDGKETLIPTVSDGADGKPPHLMGDREAIDYFKKTGQYLGKFDSIKEADAYGQALHLQQEKMKIVNGRAIDPEHQKQKAVKQLNLQQDEHLEAVAPEKQASFKRAITTKNPLALSTFEERGASIAAKLDRIRANPAYQKLSEKQQESVRAKMYDKYVEPSYKGFHLEVPPKEAWVQLTKQDALKVGSRTDANSFYDSKGTQAGVNAFLGVQKDSDGIVLFGTKVGNKIFQKLHGLGDTFSAFLPESWQSHYNLSDVITGSKEKHDLNRFDLTAKQIENGFQRSINTQKAKMDGTDVWLKSHYRDSTLNSLSNFAGEFVATLPLYEAVGVSLGAAGKTGNLSTKLASSKLGTWVAGTLKTATEGFTGSLVSSGGNKKEAVQGGVGGAVLYGVGAPIAQKVASFPLIKKWTASVLAMGGKPFAEDLAASAMHEETAFVEHGETHGKSENPNEMHVGNGIVIKHKTEGKGYISFQGVDHPYTSKEQQQELYSRIEKMAEQKRLAEDPITAQLHEAEKLSQNSVAMQLYGKPLRGLSANQRQRVMTQRLRLVGQAAEEAPVHLPELQKAEVEHDIQKELEQNPSRAARHKEWEKQFGSKVVDTVTANTVKAVATETGIKDPKAAITKISKSAQKKADKLAANGIGPLAKEYEPPDGASAFHKFNDDTIAYLKNPKGGRRASDGTLIGGRDKRAWNEILKSDNREKFIEVLKEADGDRIKFENDLHRMLYHYSNRAALETPLKNKLVREMLKLKPKTATSWTQKDLAIASDNTVMHLYELSKSGRLQAGERMYHSTNTNPNWSPTEWQMQLYKENDQEQLQSVYDALKRHPKQLKAVQSGMKVLMDMKYNAPDIQQYLALDEQIRKTALQAQAGVVGLGRSK